MIEGFSDVASFSTQGALAAAIVALWRKSHEEFRECREDRAELWRVLARSKRAKKPSRKKP